MTSKDRARTGSRARDDEKAAAPPAAAAQAAKDAAKESKDAKDSKDAHGMKRIHEFAKEQSVDTNAIIEVLKRAGLPASKCSPSSTISPEWEQRLLPLCDRLRDAQKRAAEKAAAAQAVATATKKSTRTPAVAPAAKKTATSGRTKAPATPQPKRWTEESAGSAETHELDAWVAKEAAPPREKKKSRRLQPVEASDESSEIDSIPTRGGVSDVIKAALAVPTLEPPKPTAPSPIVAREAPPPAPVEAAPAPSPAANAAAEGAAATAAARKKAADDEGARKAEEERAAMAERHAKADQDRKDREEKERREREEKERKEREKREKELSPAARAVAQALEEKKKTAAAAQAAAKGEKAPAGAAPAAAGAPAEEETEEEAAEAAKPLVDLGPVVKQDEEEEIVVALGGQIPLAGPKKVEAIVRKDKRPVVPQARPGFGGPGARGPGYGGSSYGGQTAQQRGRRQFFPMGPGRPGLKGERPRQEFQRPEKVTLTPPITLKDFSTAIGVRVPDIIAKLMKKGRMMRITDILPEDLAVELGIEYSVEVDIKKEKAAEEELTELAGGAEDRPEDLKPRAPVITILGHVDHGKTTLLDRIRKTNVAGGEAGGITQHIGAYKVFLPDGRSVAFIDTPGHEAFTEMRARGAHVTDVAVLVVDSADGVMPQTQEAYNHAKAAGVPVVVALTKVDKPTANAMRVKQQLSGLGLQPVEWGGETEVMEVSAITGKGIDDLLTTLALQADILDLKANPNKPARGTCLEARKSEGRGIVAHLLVQEGTLKRGDVVVCGTGYGKVRAIYDDTGKPLAEAGPATPVQVIGLDELPEAGANFYVLDDLSKAKEIAGQRQQRRRLEALAARPAHTKLEDLFKAGAKEVRIVLKTDVKGSAEVLQKAIPDLSADEVKVKLLHAAVGGVTESDVLLADASDAIIIGFNVVADEKAKAVAEQKGVDIRTYRVIYQITDDIKKAMEGLLEPEEREVTVGMLEIRKTFHASQIGTIAGCMVTKGKVERTNKIKLIRDGVIVHVGDIASLKRFKDDAKEVREGFECGVTIKGYNDVKEGDKIEAFAVEKVARTLG